MARKSRKKKYIRVAVPPGSSNSTGPEHAMLPEHSEFSGNEIIQAPEGMWEHGDLLEYDLVREHAVSGEHIRLKTALYARLSTEQDDDDTIRTQITLLEDYLREQEDLKLYRIYEDNGFTGTNYDRPAFQEMMNDVRSGEVECIVIKDLSRLGRNFVETGYLVEVLFPKLNVRLISINDRYDSARISDQNDLSVPIKNMVNELYAKDVSRKICASNEARRANGSFNVGKSIYGYRVYKDKEQLQLRLNPETAPVVKLIFCWFLSGMRSSEIAKNLNLLNIDTPKVYKYRHEFHKPLGKRQFWDSGKVRKLLIQEAYTGDRLLGMRRNRLFQNQHKQEWLPREEWTVYSDDHHALVTKDDMGRVLDMIRSFRESLRESKERTDRIGQNRTGLFSEIVYCKNCGFLMFHENLKYKDGRIKPEGSIYKCTGRAGIEELRGCGLKIKEGHLHALVSGQIKLLIDTVADQNALRNKIGKAANNQDWLYRIQRRIDNIKQQIALFNDKTLKLYEDLSAGLLDQTDFSDIRKHYHQETERLSEQLHEKEEELKKLKREHEKFQDLTRKLKPHMDNFRLTRELIEELIEKIDVDEAQHIEIHFKTKDVFKSFILADKEGDDA